MPKIILSIDGVVIKEVQLTKDRTTLGRRPYNDIVIDNLAISGEHAVLQMEGVQVYLEDLNSTNGTYANGKAVKKQLLQSGDAVEMGKYMVRFVDDAASGLGRAAEQSCPVPTVLMDLAPDAGGVDSLHATVRVLSGAAAGHELPLTKVVTTIGKPGVAVAAITRGQRGFTVHHVEGAGKPVLNGAPIGAEPLALKSGDLIELAGAQMQFVQT